MHHRHCQHHSAAKGTFTVPFPPKPFFILCLLHWQLRIPVTLIELCKEKQAWKSRHMGEKNEMEDFLWKDRFLHIFHVFSGTKMFPCKGNLCFDPQVFTSKKTKAKNNKKIFNLSYAVVQKQTYKNTFTKVKVRKRWLAFLEGQLFCIVHFPHVFMFRSTVKFAGGKKAFHKVLKNSGLWSLGLLIIISAKMAKDCILQKLNTHLFVNFFDTGKKSNNSWSRYLQHLHFPKCKLIFPE